MDQSSATTKTDGQGGLASLEVIDGEMNANDLNDLCDATDAAIQSGGGFGWVNLPARDILERYWEGVVVMPQRVLIVARLDQVICGTCQIIKPVQQNEAQKHMAQLTTHFVSPWARGYGLARKLIREAERLAVDEGYSIMNLDVRETQLAAISLYESEGFVHYGTHPYYAVVDGEAIKGLHYTKLIHENLCDQKE